MNRPNQMEEKNSSSANIHKNNMQKKSIIAVSAFMIIGIVLFLNLSFIQINYYTATKNTTSIINILSKELKKPGAQDKLYFKRGISYLITERSEAGRAFLEKAFLKLDNITQEKILKSYNTSQLFFASQKPIFEMALKEPKNEMIKQYFKQMPIEQFEFALQDYFGKNVELSQGSVTKLYTIASLYPKKLPLNKFQISIYDLMSFPHEGKEESMSLKLLSRCEGEAARKILLEELKTKAIDVDLFNTWIEILNKNQMVTTQEYAAFTNSYSAILQLRQQYKRLEQQKVDLLNAKKQIDVQTEAFEDKTKGYEEKIERLNQVGREKDTQLNELARYKTVELYIMDYYGEGQYEASIPQKSWFFNTYKPSNDKVIVKLTHTQPKGQGVYTFNVYEKANDDAPYYIEVSKEEMERMQQLKKEIEETINQKEELESQILLAKKEIEEIRKQNNYEQNIILLEDVEKNKEATKLKLKEEQVAIQNLFEIGNVIVEIEKE